MAEPDTTIPAEGEPLGKPGPGNSRDFTPVDGAPAKGADAGGSSNAKGGEASKADA